MFKPPNRHMYTVQHRVLTRKMWPSLAPTMLNIMYAMVVWTIRTTVAEITMVYPGDVTRAHNAVLFLPKKL